MAQTGHRSTDMVRRYIREANLFAPINAARLCECSGQRQAKLTRLKHMLRHDDFAVIRVELQHVQIELFA